MLNSKKMSLVGQILLLLATLVWGSSFLILKQTINEVPPFFVIAIRFLVSGGLLSLIFIKRLRNSNKKTFFQGVVLGICLSLAYVFQTIGLIHTTPGRNAFLTSSYCVMCPFLVWIMFKKKPKSYNVISAVLCIVGIGLVALSGESILGVNYLLGDGLTVICAVFFALQIVYVAKYQKQGSDTMTLLIYELLTVGVIYSLMCVCYEIPTMGISVFAINFDHIIKIAYLTLACTLFAQFAQIFGQKYTAPNRSAIILSLEAVFGVVFSVVMGDEKLSIGLIIGFIVIFSAVIISELELDLLKPFRKKAKNSQEISCDGGDKND